jgi:4-diphosphocytidyl-2C-methyl-D-erythritol kinase
MSGSGSSLFTLFDSLPQAEQAAEQAAERLQRSPVASSLQYQCVAVELAFTG